MLPCKEERHSIYRLCNWKPLSQFISSNDLANLFIWVLWEYDDVESVIFSGTSPGSKAHFGVLLLIRVLNTNK